jgi:hypothetical protein
VAPILKQLETWLPEERRYSLDDEQPPLTPFFEPADWGKTDQPTIEHSLASLVAIGPAAGEALEVGLANPHRAIVQVAAKALARVDAKRLIARVRVALALFSPEAKKLEELPMGQPLPKDLKLTTYIGEGRVAAEGLAALAETPGDEDMVDLLRDAVACPDPTAAERAVAALAKRLDTAHFVPALFASFAEKRRFSHDEIDIYVKALTDRPDAGPALVKTLEKLLNAAGTPDALPAIHKIVALRALEAVGDKSAVAVLERCAKDATSYTDVMTTYDRNTMRPTKVEKQERSFAELAQAALRSARGR